MGDERERLRAIYAGSPASWPQADALAEVLGLRREDVLTGEDLARHMDAFVREKPEGEVRSYEYVAWRWDLDKSEDPCLCAAFSPAATSYLLSLEAYFEGQLVAITGELVAFTPEEGRFRVRGAVSLEPFFAEVLGRAAAALRKEGHSAGLVARIKARLATGKAPSLGENLARLTGDEALRDAASRSDIDAIRWSLATRPELLERPREVLGAIGEEESFRGQLWADLSGEISGVQRIAGSRPLLLPPLAAGKALLSLFDHQSFWRRWLSDRTSAVLAVLDADRLAAVERAARELERTIEAEEWPTAEIRELRRLVAERAAELARTLPREGEHDVSRLLAAILAFAEGDDERAFALARELDSGAPYRQRASLLHQVESSLRRLLRITHEEEE